MKKLNFLMTLSLMLVSFWGFGQQVIITGISVALDYKKMNKNYSKKFLFLTKF